jgi:tetratricopeptide (TPR) repeat protein
LVTVVVGLVLVAYLRAFLRFHDRDVSSSLRRANEGDLDGAIAELRAAIDAKGPSAPRLNGLGVLFSLREAWGEALAVFDEAVRLGKRHPLFLGNQGLALRKLGRAGEAVEVLSEAIAKEPSGFLLHVHRCHALLDLGRLDEARADLERAVAIRGQQITLASKAVREEGARQMEQLLDECRARLPAATPEKMGDLTGLDEL